MLQNAGIDRLPGSRNRLEVELVTADFDEHKSAIGIKACRHNVGALAEVVVSELAGVSH